MGETDPGGLAFDYSTDLFDAVTADRMLGQLQTLLEAVVEAPDRRVSELPLLGADERKRMLVDWNATHHDYGGPVTLQGAFEAQADRTPDAPAVVFEERSLSYRELERRANQLARHLEAGGAWRQQAPGAWVLGWAGLGPFHCGEAQL